MVFSASFTKISDFRSPCRCAKVSQLYLRGRHQIGQWENQMPFGSPVSNGARRNADRVAFLQQELLGLRRQLKTNCWSGSHEHPLLTMPSHIQNLRQVFVAQT